MIGNAVLGWNTNSSDVRFTAEGGLAIKLLNKTGAPTIKGTLVNTEANVDFAFAVVTADEADIIGVVYENSIADGDFAWIVISGCADVLIEDGTTATRGYWCRASATVAGRADITNAEPPGGTINEIDNHFREIGHCLQSVVSGTDKLARLTLHFN